MYQVNYLPWRSTFISKKSHEWLYQTLSLIAISLSICGYYTYHLAQKLHSLTTQQLQYQHQEALLTQHIAIIDQEKERTELHYQHYWLHYQNWYRYLRYITFFQSIETCLPTAGWINQFSDMDNKLSLHLILPYDQSLLLISYFYQHPTLSALTLNYLQKSVTQPAYTELFFNGDWEVDKHEGTYNKKRERQKEGNDDE
ncbi:hypothetical protein [Proteus hauseri]|uniref:hypothetical protein n=1 Tax=Proteus hauseri TaxID=183417 RepID=UPI0032DA0053